MLNYPIYPAFVIGCVFAIGLPLAMIRPYWAFMFAIILLTGGNSYSFIITRTAVLGPYLNLGDACLLVALAALLFEKFYKKERLRVPKPVFLLTLILFIAALQSFFTLGWTYDTVRACRWGLQMPIAFFLGANLVTSPARARKLIGTLLCGSIMAALLHMCEILMMLNSIELSMQNYHLVRTIAYTAGNMAFAFILTMVVWEMPHGLIKRILYTITAMLFLASMVMSQTRSIWAAAIGTVPFLLVLFKKRNKAIRIVQLCAIAVVVALGATFFCQYLFPEVNLLAILTQRVGMLFEKKPELAFTLTRINQFKFELGSWLQGTLILGRGLCFFQKLVPIARHEIAFGHLGYVMVMSIQKRAS